MPRILNLTKTKATPEQVAAGVEDMSQFIRSYIVRKLTFLEIPDDNQIVLAAIQLARIASGQDEFVGKIQYGDFSYAMIGDVPFLISALEKTLHAQDIQPLHSFTQSVSYLGKNEHGDLVQLEKLVHSGWVRPILPRKSI